MLLITLKDICPDLYNDLKVNGGGDYEEGSIAHFVQYILLTFEINLESSESIFTSTKKAVDRQFMKR